MSNTPFRDVGRRSPAKGVHLSLGGPNWVFLTVATAGREHWLAQPLVQHTFHDIWQNTATAWLVSDYLLRPGHLHLFCAPNDPRFEIKRWIASWKDRFTRLVPGLGAFQRGGFHHRLRDSESHAQKWQYVRANPVRAGLVASADDWPCHGRVHTIHFS